MRIEVECYSAYKAEERPVRFRVDDKTYCIEDILDRWYAPDAAWFKVRTDDGNIYILRRLTTVPDGEWDLVSYRQAAG